MSSSGLHLARPPLPRSGRTQSETSERRNSTPHSATQSASPLFSCIRVITLSESNLTLSFPPFPLCRLCSVVTARRAAKNIECCAVTVLLFFSLFRGNSCSFSTLTKQRCQEKKTTKKTTGPSRAASTQSFVFSSEQMDTRFWQTQLIPEKSTNHADSTRLTS